MIKKKKLKISGITMTNEQWINMLVDPFKKEALNELHRSNPRALLKNSPSLIHSIHSFNWSNSLNGQQYWEKIIHDLEHPFKREPYLSTTITQLID